MTVRTRPELEAAAAVIRDETSEGANTATRVGGFCRDVVDSMPLTSEVAGGAPTAAEYLTGASHAGLSAERVVTDTTTIVWDLATGGIARANVPDASLTRAKHAHASDLSVVGRAAAGTGALQDILAPTNDRIFARVSNVLGFFQVTGPMIQSGEIGSSHLAADAVGNTALRNSGACSVIGRAANSSGDPADISATTNDRLFCRVGDALAFAQLTAGMVPNDLVTDAMLRNSAALSVLGRATNSTGDPADIVAAADDRLLARTAGALSFTQLTAGMVPNDIVTNAMAANMADSTLKGRAAGAGTGDPTDLTAAQVRTILNMVLEQVLAGGNTTGANNLAIAAAQVLQLIAGTPSTSGPANALIEFLREGGGTSSFIGLRAGGRLRVDAQDGLDLIGVSSGAHLSIASGSAASVGLSSGTAGTTIDSTGLVTVRDVRCVQYDTLADQGNAGTAKTIIWSVGGNTPSALQKVTLNNNVTFTFTNPEMPAYPLMLELHQDATGGRDCTFPSSVKDAAGLSAALLQTASTFAQVVFLWNGSFYTWQIVANGLTP